MKLLETNPKILNTKTATIALVATIATVLIVALASQSATAGSTNTFIALINGGQETPNPIASNAFGVAHLTFDETTSILCFSISYTGPSSFAGAETRAHFHSPAAAGDDASPVFTISPIGEGGVTLLGSPKNECVGPLSDDQEDDLKDGLFYINIHTTAFTGGEIRGQVLPIKD